MATAIRNSKQHRLPNSIVSFLTTSLLSPKAKVEAAGLILRIRSIDPRSLETITIAQWLDRNVADRELSLLMRALVRVTTLSGDPEQSAPAALGQLRTILRGGVVYLHEGWQKLVDALHAHAVTAGVNFVTSSRVVGVDCSAGEVRAIELGGLEMPRRNDTLNVTLPEAGVTGGGTRLDADCVLMAVDPSTAAEIVGESGVSAAWQALRPVTASCLDVALQRLPQPRRTYTVSIDRPLYLSVHSAFAQLGPRGGAMIHAMRYRENPAAFEDDYDAATIRLDQQARADQDELETLLEEMQPGWRELVVHRRFFPSITVSHALLRPGTERPSVTTPVRGLYLAGDWVGSEGMMADAALASARNAADAILSSKL